MKLKDLIRELKKIKKELQNKDVFIIGENGVMHPVEIKFSLMDIGSLDKTKKNVEFIVLR